MVSCLESLLVTFIIIIIIIVIIVIVIIIILCFCVLDFSLELPHSLIAVSTHIVFLLSRAECIYSLWYLVKKASANQL